MKQKLQELRASLQIKKGLASLRSGSVLVFTLIILFIILATALSIAGVTVIERKTSSSTGKSTASFQIADSGTEIFLKKIKEQTGTLSVALGTSCSVNQFTEALGSGSYAVTFYKQDGTQLTCADNISDVDHIKSVGTLSGTSRAVEVALAGADDPGIGTCYDRDDMLYIQVASACPSGWGQCKESELISAGKKGCLPIGAQYGVTSGSPHGCIIDDTSSKTDHSVMLKPEGWIIGQTDTNCPSGDNACCR